MRVFWLLAVVLLTACGGQTNKDGAFGSASSSEPFDLFASVLTAPEEFDVYGIRHRPGGATLLCSQCRGPLWVSPDRRAFVLHNDQGQNEVVTSDGRRTISLDGTEGVGFTWSADGTKLAIVDHGTVRFGRGDATELRDAPVATVDLLIAMIPSFSPDGRYLAIPTEGGLAIWQPETEDLVRITSRNGNSVVPIWSANSSRLALYDGENVEFVERDGSSRIPVVVDTRASMLPSVFPMNWSFDGQWFSVRRAAEDPHQADVEMFNSNGESVGTFGVASGPPCGWAPHADVFACLRRQPDAQSRLEPAELVLWSPGLVGVGYLPHVIDRLDWSPDGSRILLGFEDESLLYDAVANKIIVERPARGRWSPSGKWFAFLAGPFSSSPEPQLWTLDKKGVDEIMAGSARAFAWLPDNDDLAFFDVSGIQIARRDGSNALRVLERTDLGPPQFYGYDTW